MKLIFVYNAEAGWLNSAWDSAHKLVSPSTYACSLCAVTHHPLGMKKRWLRFIDSLNQDVEFLHRDEATRRYDDLQVDWPAVLREDERGAEVWLTAQALASTETLDDLIKLIRERLADGSHPTPGP